MSPRVVLPAALAAVLALPACAAASHAEGYLDAFSAGERAARAGRFDEAVQDYERASTVAGDRAADRDEARFLVARTQARAGRFREAQQSYARLALDSPKGLHAARVPFDTALLEIEHGDGERGFAMLEQALRANPATGVARPALHDLVAHAQDRGGEAGRLAYLEQEAPVLHATDLEQMVDYELAHALLANGRAAEAHDRFLATARAHPYPHGGLTDDAFWNAADLDVKAGRDAEAVAHLREMLAPRETTSLMGSYQRPRFSPGQLRIGEIERDGLKDHAAARRDFHLLYTDHLTSPLRPLALWDESRLAAQDGDAAAACSLAARLAKEFPDSRYARCTTQVCAAAPATGRGDCPAYILRELHGETASEAP